MPALALFRSTAIALLLAAAPAFAQTYSPQSGQAGKDVIWVPTPQALVDKMLELAKVTPNDYVIDLGSGDGRLVITAARRGTRIVSNSFNMDSWNPDETAVLGAAFDCTSFCTAYYWVVPAKVAGSYKVPQGDLVLQQTFQMLSGTLTTGGKAVPVEGKVIGEEIILSAAGKEYRGRFQGRILELR